MTRRSAHASAGRGFTLLELVISIALVLLLMLAITRIFTITSFAIGASQGFAAATRDARAAQAVFAHDIGTMAPDSPFVYIRSDPTVQAFRNAADATADKDGNAGTADFDGDGTESALGTFEVSARSHRLDVFSFCSRDRFARQTGNTGTLVSDMTSPEAWIIYDHMALPNNNGLFYLSGTSGTKTEPGYGTAITNPNNFYASQWVLGRMGELMVVPNHAPSDTPATETVVDSHGVAQSFFKRTTSWVYDATAAYSMAPFSDTNATTNNEAGKTTQWFNTRFDVVGTGITDGRDVINNYNSATLAGKNALPWYENMLTDPTTQLAERFEVNPFVVKPITSFTASQQAGVFLPSCSQFIVEFAGDFVTQDGNGNVTALVGDGTIDYSVNALGQRQIRWYGYPRDMDGDGVVSALPASTDVVTVSDFALPANSAYAKVTDAIPGPFPFEHVPTAAITTKKSHASTDTAFTYYAAWGPDSGSPSGGTVTIPRPKMYRIVLTLDRPEMAGRTQDGQTFEYVFAAPN